MPVVQNPGSGKFMANSSGMTDAVFGLTFKASGGNVLIDVLNKLDRVLSTVIKKTEQAGQSAQTFEQRTQRLSRTLTSVSRRADQQGVASQKAARKTELHARAMQHLRTQSIRVVSSMDRFIGATRRAVFVIGLFSGYITHRATRALQNLFRQFIQGTGYVIQMGATFERLKIQLRTVFREAGEATDAFAALKDIAKKTPFQLTDVVEGAAALKAVGIDFRQAVAGDQSVLTLISDLAGAMGRTIPEAIFSFKEAVAEGSFISLRRRFSITMGQIQMKLRDVAGKAGRPFEEMFDFSTAQGRLEAIGTFIKESFGGGSEAIAKTLTGIRSNLQDSLEIFTEMVSSSGPMDKFKTQAQNILSLVDNMFATGKAREWGSQVGSMMVGLQREVQKFAGEKLFKGLSTDIAPKVNLVKFVDNFVTAFGEIIARIRKGWQDNQSTIWKVGTEAVKLYAEIWINTFVETVKVIWAQWWGKAGLLIFGAMRLWNIGDALVGMFGANGVFVALKGVFNKWGAALAASTTAAAVVTPRAGDALGAMMGVGVKKEVSKGVSRGAVIGFASKAVKSAIGAFALFLSVHVGLALGKAVADALDKGEKQASSGLGNLDRNILLVKRMIAYAKDGDVTAREALEGRFDSLAKAAEAAKDARKVSNDLAAFMGGGRGVDAFFTDEAARLEKRFGKPDLFQSNAGYAAEIAGKAAAVTLGTPKQLADIREWGDNVGYVSGEIVKLNKATTAVALGWKESTRIFDDLGKFTDAGKKMMGYLGEKAVVENIHNLEDKLSDMGKELKKATEQERLLIAIRKNQGDAFSDSDKARLSSAQRLRKETAARMGMVDGEITLIKEQRTLFLDVEKLNQKITYHTERARKAEALLLEIKHTSLFATKEQEESLAGVVEQSLAEVAATKATLVPLDDKIAKLKIVKGVAAAVKEQFRSLKDQMVEAAKSVESMRNSMVAFGSAVGNALVKITDMHASLSDLRAFVAEVWEGATSREVFDIGVGSKKEQQSTLEGMLNDIAAERAKVEAGIADARKRLAGGEGAGSRAKAKSDIEVGKADLDRLANQRVVVMERLASVMTDIVMTMGQRRQELKDEQKGIQEYIADPRRGVQEQLENAQEALVNKEAALQDEFNIGGGVDPVQYMIEQALKGNVEEIERLEKVLENLDIADEAKLLVEAVNRLVEINKELSGMKDFDLSVRGFEAKIVSYTTQVMAAAQKDVEKQLSKLEEIRKELSKIREKLASQQISQIESSARSAFGLNESQMGKFIEAFKGEPSYTIDGLMESLGKLQQLGDLDTKTPLNQEILLTAVKTMMGQMEKSPYLEALTQTAKIMRDKFQLDEAQKAELGQPIKIMIHLMRDDKEVGLPASFDYPSDTEQVLYEGAR